MEHSVAFTDAIGAFVLKDFTDPYGLVEVLWVIAVDEAGTWIRRVAFINRLTDMEVDTVEIVPRSHIMLGLQETVRNAPIGTFR